MSKQTKGILQALCLVMLAFFLGTLIPKKATEVESSKNEEIELVDYNYVKDAALSNSIRIIDARTAIAFNRGNIQNSVNIPLGTKKSKLLKHITNSPTIIYCVNISCSDSTKLAEKMAELGQTNIKIYKEGWEEWNLIENL